MVISNLAAIAQINIITMEKMVGEIVLGIT